ncbi:MAG: methyltransferase domain-containing protein [Trueperaceae bacterium]|nr:MAG: methyltransferase domain-containing protein [Trueperaceae bacterium]
MSELPTEFFRRQDERPDKEFYRHPRLTSHLDAVASGKARALYDTVLPVGGHVLDLMASFHSHLPNKFSSVTALGLNVEELNSNLFVTDRIIFDLNLQTQLPFETALFDGAVCTVRIQYMIRPYETFSEVARVLKPGAPFVVTFSNKMFPTKAVLAWRASDDAAHMRLVEDYFVNVSGFARVQKRYFLPVRGDPLYAIWAYKG